MLKISLPSKWTLRAVGDVSAIPAALRDRDIPATVPGCVHTDLIAAGHIDDPYFDRNELKTEWIGNSDWRYSCEFSIDAKLLKEDRVDLFCEGLDTIARVEINGQLAGESFDMHVPCRFDVKRLLKAGANTVAVTFASPLKYAQSLESKMGTLPHVEKHPFNFIRKMACNFGWDWGPALITSGIWQPISIEGWSGARIKAVRPVVSQADEKLARVDVHVDLEFSKSAAKVPLQLSLKTPDGKMIFAGGEYPVQNGSTVVPLNVPDPKLWWPRGHGSQPLNTLTVRHADQEWSRRIGLRTVKLNTAADKIGSQFTLEVNGKPVFCKGANWIPDDCFLNRVTKDRYAARLAQAVDSNMNMLRIWGGGIYETEDFYTLCDELGLMVWQDFLFACATYSEEEPYRPLVEAEARWHVSRLSSHPSLVIWNGCNENVWGYCDWGWKDKVGARTWGFGYYTEILPKIVAELAPTTPYWAASPYSGSLAIHPLDDNHGNKHIWDAWNQVDYTVYRKYTPRFVSEFGHQAPPAYATLRSAIPASQLRPDSPAMLHHQKAAGGNDKLHGRLKEHFEIPENFDDWLFVTQLNQARAIQAGVEWFRSRQPVCMGSLYWQINDCWPVTSWAAVDGEGRKKPLWYATKKFYADRLLTIQPEPDGTLKLFALNDSDEPWQSEFGGLKICRMTFGGETASPIVTMINAPARGVQEFVLQKPLAASQNPSCEFIVARCGEHRAYWFHEIDRNLAYPAPQFDSGMTREGEQYSVKITAKTFLRDVSLFADRLDPAAEVDDQLVTLLPGESATFHFKSSRQLSKEAITSPPVLQCANRFGKQS